MGSLRASLRHAVRRLLRTPVFTLTALVTLAVGIGANTAIFTVVEAVLLKPLPFKDPDGLVSLEHTAPGLNFDQVPQSPATYFTYRDDARTLADMGMWTNASLSVTGLDKPEEVDALQVTDGFLSVLGVKPAVGRAFTKDDDQPGAPLTVMLSYGYWQRAFGGEASAVGRTLTADGETREIIGVLPRDFHFLENDPAILYPFQFDRADVQMGNFSYQAVGRLAPGATPAQVKAEMDRLLPVATERYPGPIALSMLRQAHFAAVVKPFKETVVGDVRPILWVLLGTVGMVLLIACANVANLFLVRAEGRVRDVAVRTALGAGRGHVAEQFLGESLLLGLTAGVVGLGLAVGGVRLLVAMGPSLPRLDEVGVDPLVLAFTLGVSVLAGLLFGAFPLLRYGRPNLATSLKEGSRGSSVGKERHRARNGLVVAQVALALVLLVGSGLMIRSFRALRSVDPGFRDPDHVLTVRLSLPEADPEVSVLALEQIEEKLAAIPGVTAVGAAQSIPMDGTDSNDPVFVEGVDVPPGQLPPCSATTGSCRATRPAWASRSWPAGSSPGPISTTEHRWWW